VVVDTEKRENEREKTLLGGKKELLICLAQANRVGVPMIST
jgi:hypothetical protein